MNQEDVYECPHCYCAWCACLRGVWWVKAEHGRDDLLAGRPPESPDEDYLAGYCEC